MIVHLEETKHKALHLRLQGWSLLEISRELLIAKSTLSYWMNRVELTAKQKDRLLQKRVDSALLGSRVMQIRRQRERCELLKKVETEFSNIEMSKELYKLLAAIFIWTEGEKGNNPRVVFTNSDPEMIATFLFFFRKGFDLDESKFRVLMHLHEYHNEEELKLYWSKVTCIPINQFHKSYLKPHTGKNKKEGYKGCIQVKYYKAEVASELKIYYNTLSKKIVQGA